MPTQLQHTDDRIAGCLLAGAIGDAVGSHFEGLPQPTRFSIPVDLRITDDTQLTIATCEAIIDSREVDPESIASNFTRWYRHRRIVGIGSSTLKALRDLDAGGHWALVGASGERSAGNGAAMRIAPLAFLLDPENDAQRRTIRDVSRITHRNDEAYLGALTLVRCIRHVLSERPLGWDMLSILIDPLPDSSVRDRLIVIRESNLSPAGYVARFGATGYVVDSVPLAILSAVQSTDLMKSIEEIVNCGGDTDTIASMFGNIFGAAHGLQAVPKEIADRLNDVTLIRDVTAKFAHAVRSMA